MHRAQRKILNYHRSLFVATVGAAGRGPVAAVGMPSAALQAGSIVAAVDTVDIVAAAAGAAAAHTGLEYSRAPVAAVARPGGRNRAAGRPAKGIAVEGSWGAGIAVSDAQAMNWGI